ncbi:MAG: hypothetical protein CM15mP84_00750 [Cellvibrionales bacterium]|nr:MAG: hypothetical protein CM15mP84_00750 [Cellvibrionales bacterium]
MAKVFRARGERAVGREIAEKYPLIQTDDLFGGIHIPSDGYANAVDITQALAKGAKAAARDIHGYQGRGDPARRRRSHRSAYCRG